MTPGEISAPLTAAARPDGPGVVRVDVTGEIDMTTSGILHDAIDNILTAGDISELVVDLDAVTFLDASGITVLLAGRDAATERGMRYRVVHVWGTVHRVLDITDVLDLLTDPDATVPA